MPDDSWHLLICLLAGLLAFSAVLVWMARDFARWKGLGLGGLPHSAAGWLVMCVLRVLQRDGRDPTRLTSALALDGTSHLGTLVRRQGSRPSVAPYPIPQRQLTETISAENLGRLKDLFGREVEKQPFELKFAKSFFEKHHDAITLKHPDCGHVLALISHGEIAHIHPSDGSMHMVLSPCDATLVLDRQWGELHSLAGLFNRLPASYTFVYAPRSDADFRSIQRILSASVSFMTRRDPAPSSTTPAASSP